MKNPGTPTTSYFAQSFGNGTADRLDESSYRDEKQTEFDGDARAPVLGRAIAFVRRNFWKFLAISAAVLVPCFWHRTIVAGDLGSHVYNAWLAQLIERGQAPGLWLAHRWNNVLFDLWLEWLGRVVSLQVAEKIAVSAAVLIFFWGTFALVGAASRRAPWYLCPGIAMFAYGYSFHMGFMNFYSSLGLAFFGMAIFWRGKGWELLVPVALGPLIILAHPLGFAWLAGGSAYVVMAQKFPRRFHIVLLVACALCLFAARYYFWHHDIVEAQPDSIYFFNGLDQVVLFGWRYAIPEFALLIFIFAAFAEDFRSRAWGRFHRWKDYAIPLQLYAVVCLAVILLPEAIRFPHQPSALALLTERLTSLSAAMLCCLLGVLRPRKWHLLACGAIAAVFFVFLYQDTGTINQMEAQVRRLVRTLPPDQRVLGTIKPFPGSRILIQHMLDRACVGHCFSYGNYEPPSAQFRVRATPGNRYAMFSFDDTVDMEEGTYDVQAKDLPAYQVYQCSASGKELCIRPLEDGEENDRLGVHPEE
ncbi:MAG: hypothetical protein WBY73_16170 [Candidatus Acidiferrales bacterium]